MKFLKFSQSFREFISHKTNKVGVTGIVLSGVGFYFGFIEFPAATAGILGGLGLISNRDAIHKMTK